MHRYDYRVGSSERVNRDEAERRTAVDENIVIFIFERVEQGLYYLFAVVDVEHFNLGSHQVDMAWDDVETIDVGSVYSVSHVGMVDDTLIKRAVHLFDIHSKSA